MNSITVASASLWNPILTKSSKFSKFNSSPPCFRVVCSGEFQHHYAAKDLHFHLHDAMDSSGIDSTYAKVFFCFPFCFVIFFLPGVFDAIVLLILFWAKWGIWAFVEILISSVFPLSTMGIFPPQTLVRFWLFTEDRIHRSNLSPLFSNTQIRCNSGLVLVLKLEMFY